MVKTMHVGTQDRGIALVHYFSVHALAGVVAEYTRLRESVSVRDARRSKEGRRCIVGRVVGAYDKAKNKALFLYVLRRVVHVGGRKAQRGGWRWPHVDWAKNELYTECLASVPNSQFLRTSIRVRWLQVTTGRKSSWDKSPRCKMPYRHLKGTFHEALRQFRQYECPEFSQENPLTVKSLISRPGGDAFSKFVALCVLRDVATKFGENFVEITDAQLLGYGVSYKEKGWDVEHPQQKEYGERPLQ